MHAPRPATSDLAFFSKPKSAKSGPSHPSAAVTTRVVAVHRPSPVPTVKVVARDATPASSSDRVTKRKQAADTDAPKAKRPRVSASPGVGSSRASSLAPPVRAPSRARQSPLAVGVAGSRSRSASVLPTGTPAPIPRDCWAEEDGRPEGVLSCEDVVKDIMKAYKSYFRNLDDPEDTYFEPHPTDYPVAELEYPNTGASERFILLAPKDKDHYNPIMCLENTLHAIIECYLTPEQQALFGTLPTATLLNPVDDGMTNRSPTPDPVNADPSLSTVSTPSSHVSTTSDSSLSSVSSASSMLSTLSSATSLSSLSELQPYASQTSAGPPTINYLRLFQRAKNKRDGPLFLKVMDAINSLLRLLKYPSLPADPFDPTPPNLLRDAITSWSPTGIPKPVLTRIIDETYQRAVGPHVSSLSRYSAFSSEVYGELLPAFVSEIVKATGLHSRSLFVDLGSGVGNVVLQASLETGCASFGVEVMPAPAKIARSQLAQFRARCRMWGVRMGRVELEEGDMLKSGRVDEMVAKADVVLVNNKVFLESLNEALRPKFLDLKEGAIVVSLKPFVSSTRLTERNLDDISAIFQVTERQYYPGSVSWGSGGGSYFLHRVDREGYADIKKQLESSRSTSVRSTRSRRS